MPSTWHVSGISRPACGAIQMIRASLQSLGYWTDLAKTLEAGGFDLLFLADVLGAYDVYGGSRDAAVADAAQFPVNDPTLAVSAMAAVTETLGSDSPCRSPTSSRMRWRAVSPHWTTSPKGEWPGIS